MKNLAPLTSLLMVTTCLVAADKKGRIDAEKKALIQAEAHFEAARAQKGAEGWLSFFADDAVDSPAGRPITLTKAAMREHLSKTWNPDTTLKWQPVKEDVSASGDLGHTVGTWQLTGKSRGSLESCGRYRQGD